jgi:hypothetical protein
MESAAVVQIKIRESGLEDFQCSVDEKVGSALLYLREKKHFQGGLIYSHDEPLDCELTFRDQMMRDEAGELILTGLVYKNGRKDGGIQTDLVFFML